MFLVYIFLIHCAEQMGLKMRKLRTTSKQLLDRGIDRGPWRHRKVQYSRTGAISEGGKEEDGDFQVWGSVGVICSLPTFVGSGPTPCA